MFQFIRFCSAGLILVLAQTSFAASSGSGYELGLSTMAYSKTESQTPNSSTGTISGSDSKLNLTYMDLKFGYTFANQVYAGMIYDMATYDSGSSYTPKRTVLGLSVGYHKSGFILDLSYFLMGEFKSRFADGDKLSSPSGFGLDIGYNFMMNSNFYLGVQMSYKNLTFSKYSVSGGADVSTSWKSTELYPMLNLGFNF